MIGALDWAILVAGVTIMTFAAIRSKILFEDREVKRAVFWATLLVFVGRWTLLRWTNQQQNTVLSYSENNWLTSFLNSDEFTAVIIFALAISSINLSINWANVWHIFRVEKQRKKLIQVESEHRE